MTGQQQDGNNSSPAASIWSRSPRRCERYAIFHKTRKAFIRLNASEPEIRREKEHTPPFSTDQGCLEECRRRAPQHNFDKRCFPWKRNNRDGKCRLLKFVDRAGEETNWRRSIRHKGHGSARKGKGYEYVNKMGSTQGLGSGQRIG